MAWKPSLSGEAPRRQAPNPALSLPERSQHPEPARLRKAESRALGTFPKQGGVGRGLGSGGPFQRKAGQEGGGQSHCKNCWLQSCVSYQVTGKKVKGEICVEKEKEQGGGVWEGVGEVFRLLASCFAARLRRQPLSRPLFLLPSHAWGVGMGVLEGLGPEKRTPAGLLLKNNLASFPLTASTVGGGVGGQNSGLGLFGMRENLRNMSAAGVRSHSRLMSSGLSGSSLAWPVCLSPWGGLARLRGLLARKPARSVP